ncbi:sterol desaturase family protein [Beijerinckia mobilis]|uniref:sterol desaturase family protein n=1 Tax=Beijerinckia mobilis TaxID=231434 RepID=UPI00054DFFAF|nr:sterol desaturase family protein [Beijerinckia mobilis]
MQKTAESLANDSDHLSASPRLFENPLLDKLSRVHWSVPLFVYIPVILALAVVSLQQVSPLAALGGFLIGYVIWIFTEYFGHRFPFHWQYPGTFGKRIHFLIHGVHHVHPSDPLRLVMPVLLSVPIMLIAHGILKQIFPAVYVYPVLTGFITGYLIYDETHYYLHHADPKTKLGIFMRRFHMLHHFRDPTRGFGVSVPFMDYIFGTQHIRPKE